MANQRLTITKDGTVGPARMVPHQPSFGASKTPSIKLSRIQELLLSQRPSICVVRGEGIGDVLMTTPTIYALKTMFKEVNITYATNTRYLDGALTKTLIYNPAIDHIIERDLLVDDHFDLVINLHCPAIHLEKKGARPPNRIDIFAKHAGVSLKDFKPHFYLQKEELEGGEAYYSKLPMSEKFILVQPHASAQRRSFDPAKVKKAITELYTHHKIRSIIITHKSDHADDVLWNNIPGSILLENVDVRGIASVMVYCDLVLCPDSAILHLAGALDVPTVSIFGPTWPPARINHYKQTVALWGGDQVNCKPCWYESCDSRYSCCQYITSEMIVAKCLEHLQNTSKISISDRLTSIRPIQINTEII